MVTPYRLAEVLLRIGELKLTGRLTLVSDMGRRTILLHSGFPVFTQSSLFAERLGAIGVRHGFFGREDVARALTHARDRKHGLGESLLELGYVDPARLHAVLGVQLREVVAASCGGSAQRARFQGGGAALRDVIILKLNPMTAALAAMAALPASEQGKLLEAIASRKLSSAPVPALAKQWLSDLGYMGDNELLVQGEPSVSAVRSRLLARYRADADRAFDPAQVPFAFPGARVLVQPCNPGRIADLVTLTLLMAGALKLADTTGSRAEGPNAPLANTADSLQLALEEAVDRPLVEARASAASPHVSATDRAIEVYLNAKRERTAALEAAVWGPSADVRDGSVPAELMQLYLTLKAEKRPEVVLGTPAGAPAEQVMQAYARRAGLLASVDRATASEHLRCRAAELSQRFDDALDALLPGSSRTSLPPTAVKEAPAAARSSNPPSEAPGPERAAGREPSQTNLATARPDTRASARSEAIAAKVDALMRAGQWRAVLDTFEAHPPAAKLSFTLQLARAMAQRELEGRRSESRWAWIFALIAGIAVGYLLRHYGGLPRLP
jgi:hypothetical protein